MSTSTSLPWMGITLSGGSLVYHWKCPSGLCTSVYTNIKPGVRYVWTDARISLNCHDLKCGQCVCV